MTTSSKPVWASIIEKAAWTFVQAFLVGLLAVPTLDWSTAKVALAAGVAALISFALASVNAAALPEGNGFYTDLGLRLGRTGVAAFLSFLLIDQSAVLTGDVWKGAAGAAGAAVLVALKGAASKFVGSGFSAALLPADLDPTPPPYTP
ncbi:MAG: hypothetical protein ACOYOQ_00040 [Microthrixaceae bacterium]